MTDPKAGIADIRKKKPFPNYLIWPKSYKEREELIRLHFEQYHAFQRDYNVKSPKVSDYNSKAGRLEL